MSWAVSLAQVQSYGCPSAREQKLLDRDEIVRFQAKNITKHMTPQHKKGANLLQRSFTPLDIICYRIPGNQTFTPVFASKYANYHCDCNDPPTAGRLVPGALTEVGFLCVCFL